MKDGLPKSKVEDEFSFYVNAPTTPRVLQVTLILTNHTRARPERSFKAKAPMASIIGSRILPQKVSAKVPR